MKIIPGMIFGHLTVIKDSGKRQQRKIMWECECDCEQHNHILVRTDALTTGNTISCGCTKKGNKNRRVDLTNKRNGHLVAISLMPNEEKYNQNLLWVCQCDCGRTTIVSSANFYHTNSCGFCSNSKGEEKIEQLLQNNNLNFIREKRFSSCRFKDTNNLARFDFYIPIKNYIIEFDGRQHFEGWGKLTSIEKIQEHDKYKNQWCKDNNIPLIRIPYWHLQDLCIEDLQLETSKFIVGKECDEVTHA